MMNVRNQQHIDIQGDDIIGANDKWTLNDILWEETKLKRISV